jgi:16S rRNA (uracil1498-N3)-methyltransferase
MQIRRFYCPDIPATGLTTLLSEDEARHALKVLRLRHGERMLLLDGKGIIAEAELLDGDRAGRKASCRILSQTYYPEAEQKFRLYVAPPHGKGFELVLKTAIEMGVTRISPIICRHSVAKPEEISDNWRKVMVAACKQAVNPRIPKLDQPEEFRQALRDAQEEGFFGAVPECRRQTLTTAQLASREKIALWIGPEGGFDNNEEAALLNAGYTPLTIGKCVLRVETAVPALIGMIHGIINTKQQDE